LNRTVSARTFLKQIATLWFVGYLPVAPGTWGSLAATFLLAVTKPAAVVHALLIVLVCLVGVAAADAAEKIIGEKDSGHIVIDEVAGLMVSMFLVPQGAGYLAAGFFLFRFFDILKPYPIRFLERSLRGGLGVMADDILAGIYANLILQVWIRLLQH
jgi:phosphatidylglycerophosphatase A